MKKIITTIIFISLCLPSISFAEYCDMVGCRGDIYWIWVPKSQYQANGLKTIKRNDKSYQYNRSKRLFVEDKLPEVNEIVTLNVNLSSLDIPMCFVAEKCNPESEEHLKQIINIDTRESNIYHDSTLTSEINDTGYQNSFVSGGRRGSWNLNEGAKLRIMGYQYMGSVLFALVYYVSEK